jgi:monoamine oxidase
MAIYDEPCWRADGPSGRMTSVDGPVNVMFDNSPPAAVLPALDR